MTTDKQYRWSRLLLAPLWNPREHRIRAFWRILFAVIAVLVLLQSLTAVVVQPLELPIAVANLLRNGIAVLVTIGVLVVWARYVDRREIRTYGFSLDSSWWRMLGFGVVVALVGWGGALATDLAFGWASVVAVFDPGTGDLPFPLAYILFTLGWLLVGFWEEVIFRGIVMRNAIEGLNFDSVSSRTALLGGWILSSVLFGLLHMDQATSLIAIVFWILAGLILGLAYLLTDQLAFPIGLHFAFDFGVNSVFGLASVREVGRTVPTMIRPEFTGPAVYVGVSGVINTAWLLIIGVVTLALIRWQYGSLHPRIEAYAIE